MASTGIIRTGSQFPILIETERNILSLQDTLAVTYNRCDHVIGTSWVAGAFASDPSNADLETPGNWAAAYLDTRLIPIVAIQSLSSFKSLVYDELPDADPSERFAKHPAVVAEAADHTAVPTTAPSAGEDAGYPGTREASPKSAAVKTTSTKTTKKD